MAASSISNDEVHDGTHQKCQMICGVSFWVEKMGVAESSYETISEGLEVPSKIRRNHSAIQQRQKMYALRFAEVKSQVLNKSNIILES